MVPPERKTCIPPFEIIDDAIIAHRPYSNRAGREGGTKGSLIVIGTVDLMHFIDHHKY